MNILRQIRPNIYLHSLHTREQLLSSRPQLFKRITLYIHWINLYPLDSVGLRAQRPKYDWDQGSEEKAQGSEEWDQGSQGF